MPFYWPSLEGQRHVGRSCGTYAMDAYLDIETTGLSPYYDRITVIGVGLPKGRSLRVTQLYDNTLTKGHLADLLEGVSKLYTYNGGRFDLPFIHQRLGLDITAKVDHYDLMYDCWQGGLYGGLKAVEARLGIARESAGMTGRDAVLLWRRYQDSGDEQALEILLAYNREDVSNLEILRRKLGRNA